MPGAAPRRCIVCEAPPRRAFRLPNGAWLWRCPRCRLGWWDWPPFEPAARYNRDYFQCEDVTRGYDDYTALETGLRRTARARLKRIRRLTAAGADRRLLDIGCGTGVFLDAARRDGWNVRGIEVSEYAAAQARRRGLPVFCAPIDEVPLEPRTFDCVTLWDVIEHVPDPLDSLRRAALALRPGGVLALSTGDITSPCARFGGPRWHLFNLPEHLFFFSPQCLRTMLGIVGCRLRLVNREVNWVPVAYLLERIWKSTGRPAPGRPAWVGNLVVPATLFDVLGMYAVRCPQQRPSRRA